MIPPEAVLTKRHPEIPAWDEMPAALKPVLARQMEVYAGFLEHTDYHVGLLIDALEDLEVLDDTLIYYIIGDNGASGEGSLQGCFNEMASLGGFGFLETPEFLARNIDKFGGLEAYNHYAVGWAHAMDTPYQWTKQIASHWGGTRNGTVVHWPRGIRARGEVRSQFHHVIDVAPTAGGVRRDEALVPALDPLGTHQMRMEFAYDGGGLAKGGAVTLYTDSQKVGEGRVEMTEPFGFSADETFDVGMEAGSPVSPDYGPRGNAFNGEVNWLEMDADKAALDEDHILTGAERFRVAMALQ